MLQPCSDVRSGTRLMTTDMKAAETFYKTVVGWTSAPFDGSPQPYTMFSQSSGVPVAGLMERPAEVKAPPFWAMYVGVPKLEEAVAHIKRLGGSECSPVIEVPDRRPHADDEGPAGRRLLHLRAGERRAAARKARRRSARRRGTS